MKHSTTSTPPRSCSCWRVGKRVLRWLLYALLLLALLGAAFWALLQSAGGRSALGNQALVQTSQGWVQGWRLPGRSVFLGIPYAQPPVGALRFTAPQAAGGWSGTRLGLLPGAMCAQPAVAELRVPGSRAEDCLYLNVFKPVNTTGKPLPVMVWIHGGGFVLGSGNFTLASDLAVQGQVIVVSLNYRLGPFGFLAHPSLVAENEGAVGNYGLLDQQLAIAWARRNAAAFGGDANNVTIFGQSAGGSSVCAQLVSPAMRGQFQAAIIQSGVCNAKLLQSMPAALKEGEAFAKKLGCSGQGKEALACLRGLPPEKLLAGLGQVGVTSEVPMRPVYGSAVMPEAPETAFASGRFARVPLLIGSTKDEGTLLIALGVNQDNNRRVKPLSEKSLQALNTPVQYGQELVKRFGVAHQAELLARYPLAHYGGSGWAALGAILTDAYFACDAESLRRSAAHYSVPVYGYEFDEAPLNSFIKGDQSGIDLKAYHGAEFPFVFYNPMVKLSSAQEQYAQHIRADWARFAWQHEPEAQGRWPVFDAQQQVQSLRAQGEVASGDFYQRHQCEYWLSGGAPPFVSR